MRWQCESSCTYLVDLVVTERRELDKERRAERIELCFLSRRRRVLSCCFWIRAREESQREDDDKRGRVRRKSEKWDVRRAGC